jgi:hypothetical protein
VAGHNGSVRLVEKSGAVCDQGHAALREQPRALQCVLIRLGTVLAGPTLIRFCVGLHPIARIFLWKPA